MKKIANCEYCGKEYVKTNPRSKYCSPECRHEVYKEGLRKYDKQKREGLKSERPEHLYCVICGKEIDKNSPRSKHCSVECAKIGARLKSAERYRATLKEKKEKTEGQLLNAHVLDEAEREVGIYNKTHGTDYSYGWYQHLKKAGKL